VYFETWNEMCVYNILIGLLERDFLTVRNKLGICSVDKLS